MSLTATLEAFIGALAGCSGCSLGPFHDNSAALQGSPITGLQCVLCVSLVLKDNKSISLFDIASGDGAVFVEEIFKVFTTTVQVQSSYEKRHLQGLRVAGVG